MFDFPQLTNTKKNILKCYIGSFHHNISKKCVALRDLVPFVDLKKPTKHPSMSVTFNKFAGSKSNAPP